MAEMETTSSTETTTTESPASGDAGNEVAHGEGLGQETATGQEDAKKTPDASGETSDAREDGNAAGGDVSSEGAKTDKAKPAPKGDKDDRPEDERPITDWSKVAIKFPKGFEVNEESYSSFGDVAVKAGLTSKQAQSLIDWQINEINAYKQALHEVGTEELQKAWGSKFDANRKAAIGFVQRIDRMMGDNEFSKALNASGAVMHPGIVKALYKMSEVIAEDSMGMNSGAGADEKETALEGILNRLNEQRKGRGGE